MKIFVLYDKKSETYDRQHFFKTIPEAVRAFELALGEKESIFSKYKEDFEMHCVGEIDMEKAIVKSIEHQVICRGVDYIPLEKEDAKK